MIDESLAYPGYYGVKDSTELLIWVTLPFKLPEINNVIVYPSNKSD